MKILDAIRLENLNELLEICDIISINCPLTSETKGIIDENFITKMKAGSSLVNTARGGNKDIDDYSLKLESYQMLLWMFCHLSPQQTLYLLNLGKKNRNGCEEN